MKNLLLSSLLLLVLASCHPGHYNRLTDPPPADLKPQPIFAGNFNSFLFKTSIQLYGKDFSGLLVTKQMAPQDYRVIFTTELGMKLFDFQFRDTTFTLHYTVPQFDRPRLLSIIRQDIEVLLMNNMDKLQFSALADKSGATILRTDTGKRDRYYFIGKDAKKLLKIEEAEKRRKKVIFTFSEYQEGFPSQIVIQHYDVKLRTELNLLKK